MVSYSHGDYSASPMREPPILVVLVQEDSSNEKLPTFVIRLVQGSAVSFTRIIPFSRLESLAPEAYPAVQNSAPTKGDSFEPVFQCSSSGRIIRRLHYEGDPHYSDLSMLGVLYRTARNMAEEKQRKFGPTTRLEDHTHFSRTLILAVN